LQLDIPRLHFYATMAAIIIAVYVTEPFCGPKAFVPLEYEYSK